MSKITCYLKRSSPTILTCLGVVGVIGTVIMTAKATPKALAVVEEKKRELETDILTPAETVEAVWKYYVPAALTGTATIACIIGINCMSRRNQASLASAYGLINESYRRYREATNKVYGDDADAKIKAEIAKETYISAAGLAVYDANMDADSEKILCYEFFSCQYFYTTMAAVLNAQYHVNRNLQLRGYVPINEYYEFLGLDGIEHGDSMGWDIGELMESGFMWLDFENYKSVTDDGMECCVISPFYGPNRFEPE